ncbi:hypothetical protein H4S14_002707 [Agrobacterium vitis]|nr:hypothetical protein [Agrobacterium vitis]MBE1438950.1 hypothetical protein [Agrobacterium vitis]
MLALRIFIAKIAIQLREFSNRNGRKMLLGFNAVAFEIAADRRLIFDQQMRKRFFLQRDNWPSAVKQGAISE